MLFCYPRGSNSTDSPGPPHSTRFRAAADLDKSKVTKDLFDKLSAVAAVKASTPGADGLLLVLEETAGSSGGGCDNVTDRMVAGFCWMNTLMTVGRAGFDRVHRQGWCHKHQTQSSAGHAHPN